MSASRNLTGMIWLISVIGTLTVSGSIRAEGVTCGAAAQAGKIRLGGPHISDNQLDLQTFHHDQFDRLLKTFVDDKGRVCYLCWKNDPTAFGQLEGYLLSLGSVEVNELSHEHKLALYINAYNALTIWAMLREYPLPSIQRLNRNNIPYQIFDDVELWLGNQYLSLNAIENDVLRPLGDFRIHFSLVCAANGCPRLRNEAYRPKHIHWQLDQNAREFFSDRSRFRVHRITKTVHLSPILKWYGEDFGANKYQVVFRVFPYLPQQDQNWLSTHSAWKVAFLGYDWGLNDQCPTASVRIGRIPYCLYAKVDPLMRSCRSETSEIDRSPIMNPSNAGRQEFPDAQLDLPTGDPPLPANPNSPGQATAPTVETPLPD